MKKLLLLLSFVAVASLSNAQELPKQGVNLTVETPKVVIDKGVKYNFDLVMVRSNRAKKAKFELPRVLGPKGIEFNVEQSESNPDLYKITANAENMEPGKYFYTVTCKGKGMQKAKGLSMSFEVTDGPSMASN